eukprot:425222_1
MDSIPTTIILYLPTQSMSPCTFECDRMVTTNQSTSIVCGIPTHFQGFDWQVHLQTITITVQLMQHMSATGTVKSQSSPPPSMQRVRVDKYNPINLIYHPQQSIRSQLTTILPLINIIWARVMPSILRKVNH